MEIDNDIFAKLIAHRLGREPTQEEIDESRKRQEEAVGLASGVVGSVNPVKKFQGLSKALGQETVEGTPSFLDKYRQAVANTKVRQMDDIPQALGKVTVKEPPASALGKVTTIGSKVDDVVEPIIPNDRRMKLLEMIKQDKKLLGK
jgi:hypothetical protein